MKFANKLLWAAVLAAKTSAGNPIVVVPVLFRVIE